MCPTNLILCLGATIGLTSIIVDSRILATPRDALLQRWPTSLGYLATCYQCAGTYSGAACAMLAIADNAWSLTILGALAGSAAAQIFASGMNALEKVRV